ncbi:MULTISPECIES: helix-turn-helix domain-containing protein [Cupriavidus]|uniref:helix-turn-helix domain-containing protein n=1 Tax=Cupriavidus sp. DF5525 TaxID=3160989 RepID=UPI0032DFEF56
MDQRLLFIAAHLRRTDSVSALCERYGISRKTGYKWIERYANEGIDGLAEHSRSRHMQQRIAYPIRQAILELRGRGGMELGPKKIQQRLAERFGEAEVPSRTTIYKILKAAGKIDPRRKRRRVARYGTPLRSAREPNALWSADFKGQFLTADQCWCYPLTIMDHASRYLLGCKGLGGPKLGADQVGVRAAVPLLWAAGPAAHRQRRAVRVDRLGESYQQGGIATAPHGNQSRPADQKRPLDSQPLRRRAFWLLCRSDKSDPPRRAEPSGSTAATCHQQRVPSSNYQIQTAGKKRGSPHLQSPGERFTSAYCTLPATAITCPVM